MTGKLLRSAQERIINKCYGKLWQAEKLIK